MHYVTAGSILKVYKNLCLENGFEFSEDLKVNPYDDTTLFCVAGMQQFKELFSDESVVGTKSNVQSCLRFKDLDEIEDGIHSLHFHMLGLFSFRQLTMQQSVDLFLEFLRRIGLKPDYVTIHPDKMDEWRNLYPKDIEIRPDEECIWSDGNIGGYCTEFYIDDVEIGNIVNPLGTCIDVGFGLERLDLILTGHRLSEQEVLTSTVLKLVDSGYSPGNKQQYYVLRKLLSMMIRKGFELDHPFWYQEKERHNRKIKRYTKLKKKHSDKAAEWWWSTHGIDISEF